MRLTSCRAPLRCLALAPGPPSQGRLWSWGVNDEGSLGRRTAGSCWDKKEGGEEGAEEEGAEEEDDDEGLAKGDAMVPGLVQTPKGVKKFTQVSL